MEVIKKWITQKFITVMKIGCVQGMIAMMLCGVAVANVNYAQVLEKEVTLNLQAVSFHEALREIGQVTKIKFMYSTDQLGEEDNVSIVVTKRPLREVLEELLAPRGIQYFVHEREGSISLRKNKTAGDRGDPEEQATRKTEPLLRGSVKDALTAEPIAGVNILVKGTTNGTTSDSQGTFTIFAESNEVLVFSFIGYTSVEVPVGDRTTFDITLKEDILSLGEVEVNAGYYKTTRETQTGNIARIDAAQIEKQPVSNPMAALMGRVPGLEITQTTGVPGGNFKVRIRGTNSISNGNDPLFIVDGVPFMSASTSFRETSSRILGNPESNGGTSPLNSINPSDIESIEVLKDADATAIYGSRGSNGVILITTKKGRQGKTNANVSFYSGVANVPRSVDLLSRDQYLTIRNEAYDNDGYPPDPYGAPDLVTWDTTRSTDWQKKLIGGNASITDVQMSLSGGEMRTQFMFGMGYHRETTVFPGSNSDQRISAHLTLSHTSTNEKLKAVFSVNYAAGFSDLLNQDLTWQALTLPPNAPALYDEQGELSWTNWNYNFENPLAYLDRRYDNKTYNLITNATIGYSLLKNLEFKTSFGYTSNVSRSENLVPVSSLDPEIRPSSKNTTHFSNSTFQNWIIEPQLNWKPSLGQGVFDVLAGTTFLNQVTEGLAQTGSGFASEALMENLAAAPTRTVGTNHYAQYRYHAVFGRINYTWKQKYIINFTGRWDGSSRFGPGKQFAYFGAIGTAWIFSDEKFMKDVLPVLSFGKIRASYGTTGNDQLGDYQYLDSYTVQGSGVYQSGSGLTPARLSNPDFAWETNHKLEAALDLGFLENRIMSSFAVYRNESSNQLVGFPLPNTTGFTSVQGNFPATVRNTGVEIELTTHNINKDNFSWTTGFNISVPRNKLVSFPRMAEFPAYADMYVVGEPLTIAKVFHYTGLDASSGEYTFEDVNNDDEFDQQDMTQIKFLGPYYYGGLVNTLRYKGFELDFLFQFVKQSAYDMLPGVPGSGVMNQHVSVMDRWQHEGDKTNVHRATTLSSYESYLYSTSNEAITDASFIRLKNVSFSYTLSQSLTDRIHLNQARIFVQGQNLLTITGYDKGLDPETAAVPSLPPLRTLTAGIHVTFPART